MYIKSAVCLCVCFLCWKSSGEVILSFCSLISSFCFHLSENIFHLKSAGSFIEKTVTLLISETCWSQVEVIFTENSGFIHLLTERKESHRAQRCEGVMWHHAGFSGNRMIHWLLFQHHVFTVDPLQRKNNMFFLLTNQQQQLPDVFLCADAEAQMKRNRNYYFRV